MPKAKFKHFPRRPKKLTTAFIKKQYDDLVGRIEAAEASDSPAEWIKLFRDWNELKSYESSEYARTYYAYHRNMADKQLQGAEKYFREKVSPLTIEPEHKLVKALLDSKHRDAVANQFGEQLIPVYETQIKPLDPVNIKLGIKARKLDNEYDELIAKATVSVKGQKMTLWKARMLLESPDESVRKAAYLATRGWVLQNRPKLARLYGNLVQLRTQMAKNVGYENFIPLAYLSMCRTDYGEREAAAFRESVRKHIVPINQTIAAGQAKALGRDKLLPWDGYDPRLSLPLGIVPIKTQLTKAQKVFDRLSPELGRHFKNMRRLGLIDLENRENKRSGAYCTDFSDEGKPAILLNSTGDEDDVQTLTHEMGHAFQGWESAGIEAVDLQWGTMDLAEVLSTGMEYLSLPYIDEFFKPEDAEKFRTGRWLRSIGLLCYVCVVDEFQHWVYANPTAKPAGRDKKWNEISEKYLPTVDFTGYEKYRATRWYMQGHIFTSPFYYIDYALAETGSMQLAMIAQNDHAKAMDIYMKLCRIGGTKSFLEAFSYAGLHSPFTDSTIKHLAEFARSQLDF